MFISDPLTPLIINIFVLFKKHLLFIILKVGILINNANNDAQLLNLTSRNWEIACQWINDGHVA